MGAAVSESVLRRTRVPREVLLTGLLFFSLLFELSANSISAGFDIEVFGFLGEFQALLGMLPVFFR